MGNWMRTLREWIHRFSGTLRPRRCDDDLKLELRTHLELAAESAQRRGDNPDDAALIARIQAGGSSQAMDALRDQRGLPWLDDLARDVNLGVITLRRSPAFTAVALLTLTLGIGANAAIFSIVKDVILRPLPYPKSEQLMYVTTEFPLLGVPQVPVSALEYLEFRRVNRSFAAIGAFTTGEVNLTADDRAQRVRSAAVDEHLLNALAVKAAHGRLFAPGETDTTAAPVPGQTPPLVQPVVILSHELWQSAFGGQPIVGQTVEVFNRRREVIGIMPPGTDVMDNRTEIWLPLGLNPANPGDPRNHFLRLIGRLHDQVTVEAAKAELRTLNANWGEGVVAVTNHTFAPMGAPNADAGHVLQMMPLQDQIVGTAARSIWVLQLAAGFVLLIACANLANLLLARAEARHREFAVRTALGASKGRLLRQFVIEGALLSIASGALALWLAHVGLQTLIQSYPAALPRTTEINVDLFVLLFACGVATATSMFFGLAQLIYMGVKGQPVALKEAGTKGAIGTTRHHVRRGLVVAEVALAFILVIGAGLLMRTVYNLANVDAGFNRSRLVTFSITFPVVTYPQPALRLQAYQRLLDALRAVPGVEAATTMVGLPPNRPAIKNNTRVANAMAPSAGRFEIVDYYQYVMTDYFETMGIPIVRGRGFQPTDAASSGMVAVVNEQFVERFWKGQDAIGQRIKPCCNDQPPWFTVIGVAKDVKQAGVDQEAGTELYLFVEQTAKLAPTVAAAPGTMNAVLRTTLPLVALSRTIEDIVREVDRTVPVVRLRDMEAVFTESIQRPRLLAQLLGLFAGLALLLAAVGTYGVFSYIVAARRGEIGIRMALGANRSSVLVMMLKQGLQLTIIGIVVGLAGVFVVNRLLASLLFGVQPTDPTTLAAVIMTIVLVAAVACWVPAWRASRLDPNAVLRTA
jgi:putative ABC transport system permease protein